METSYAYFKNCPFLALDITPTLDVLVLFYEKRRLKNNPTESCSITIRPTASMLSLNFLKVKCLLVRGITKAHYLSSTDVQIQIFNF